jgi:hypothetical protein
VRNGENISRRFTRINVDQNKQKTEIAFNSYLRKSAADLFSQFRGARRASCPP